MALGHRAGRTIFTGHRAARESEKEQTLVLTPGREVELYALASQSSFSIHGSGYNQLALLEEALNQPQPFQSRRMIVKILGIQDPSVNISFPVTCQRLPARSPHGYLSESHRPLQDRC